MTSPARKSGTDKKRTKEILRHQPCLVCGHPDDDPAHWPTRRSQGAGWGLLEVIPLCRFHHRKLDAYEPSWVDIVGFLGEEFHGRMYLCYKDSGLYLGPEDRIEEVRCRLTFFP